MLKWSSWKRCGGRGYERWEGEKGGMGWRNGGERGCGGRGAVSGGKGVGLGCGCLGLDGEVWGMGVWVEGVWREGPGEGWGGVGWGGVGLLGAYLGGGVVHEGDAGGGGMEVRGGGNEYDE